MLINSTAELKAVIGGTPLSNHFENISPSIEDAKHFVIPFVGKEAYRVADDIAGGKAVDGVSEELQKEYLSIIQKPIAWKAQHDYVPEANVIMDDTGIHVQKSNDGQTAAWQWQVYDLQELYLKKAYNTLNELLVFLDENRDGLPFWKDSDGEKQRQKLFVQTPWEFGTFFDLKGSFALLLTIAPDMLLIQRTTIRTALKADLYKTITEKLQTKADLTESEQRIFEACKPIVCYYALARRIVTLPAALMPDGVVEYYHGDRMNMKASNNIRLEILEAMKNQLQENGDAALNDLLDILSEDDGRKKKASWATTSQSIGF